jgi:O-antigen ligase
MPFKIRDALSLPLWSLLLGGISISLAGRQPTVLYFDGVLLAWLLYQIVVNGFVPSFSGSVLRLGGFFLLAGMVSALVNYEDMNRSLAALKVLAGGLLIYAIARKSPPNLSALSLWGAVVGVLLLLNYRELRYGTYEGVAGLKDEIEIAMGRSNYIASILVLLIPLAVAGIWLARGAGRWLFAGCAMLMVAGLVCTMSRGAMLALLLATVLSLPLAWKGGMRLKHMAVALLFLALVLALLPQDLLTSNFLLFTLRWENPDVSREALLQATWESFRENPLLGVGPGQLSPAIAHHLMVPWYDTGTMYANAHNLVVDALAENGLPAGLVLLTMVGIVLRRAWVVAVAHPNALHIALWIALLAAVLHNLVEASFEGQQFQVIFWVVAALTPERPAMDRSLANPNITVAA